MIAKFNNFSLTIVNLISLIIPTAATAQAAVIKYICSLNSIDFSFCGIIKKFSFDSKDFAGHLTVS